MKKLMANYLGEKTLVEQCDKIDINDILRAFSQTYKKDFIQSRLAIEGINILLTHTKVKDKGERLWFQCPICNCRASKLYRRPSDGKVGCRVCLNLEYACRRFKGM